MADISGITTPTVDVSSYRNALPTGQTSPLQIATQLGALEQQKTALDQQKFNLAKDKWGAVQRELGILANDKNVTRDKVLNRVNMISKVFGIPKEQFDEFIKDIPSDAQGIRRIIEDAMLRGASVMEQMEYHLGKINVRNVGGQDIVTRESPKFGVIPTGQQFPHTPPSTSEVIDTDPKSPTYNQKRMLGPQLYPGLPAASPGPVQQGAPLGPPPGGSEARPVPVPATPIPPGGLPTTAGSLQAAPNGLPVVQAPASAAPISGPPRPTGPVTGFAPGVAEAEIRAGSASGEQLARARTIAANYQRDIFPLIQAIPALERLGTKGTGPGTDEINLLKSFVLSNVPGVKESDFNGTVADYDKAKKYLTDFVIQTGNTETNDKLAAAFAGNPSVGISNAAAVDVAKSALALRKMQQAAILDFERKGLPASQFSRYIAQLTNTLDPRAFGFNLMGEDKQKKLVSELKKNPTEAENFRKSYELAKELGLI